MKSKPPITNLEGLINRLDAVSKEGERVTFGRMLEVVGRRSFGPILLATGLIVVTPLSGVPGVPTTIALIVLLVGGQLLLGRDHFWLPRWILRRGVSCRILEKGLGLMRSPARGIDRLIRPRLTGLTEGVGAIAITVWCVFMSLFMPPLELVPFATSVVGAVFLAFGLSLIAHDGLLALVALAIAAATVCLMVRHLF